MANNLQRRFVECFAAPVFCLAALVAAPMVRAQSPGQPDTTDSTTEDSTGIVIGVPRQGVITVDSRRGPFTYRLGLDLHVTGPDNKPLKIAQVQAGDEATVFYYLRDGYPTVGRIVVLKQAAASNHGK
jgi:hypothetical protein